MCVRLTPHAEGRALIDAELHIVDRAATTKLFVHECMQTFATGKGGHVARRFQRCDPPRVPVEFVEDDRIIREDASCDALLCCNAEPHSSPFYWNPVVPLPDVVHRDSAANSLARGTAPDRMPTRPAHG